MKVIFDLPDGLTKSDIEPLKNEITRWAKDRIMSLSGTFNIKAARVAALNSKWGSLAAFCTANGYPPCTAWYAMQGKSLGPKGRAIIKHIKCEFGV